MSQTVGRERKLITVLFADVVDSTAIAEEMDPEDWSSTMNHTFDLMSEAVEKYGGTVAQFLGDGILAFFGAPVAHEDDPQRAVWAALQIQDSVAEQHRTEQIQLRVRIGINTGPVIVGKVGSLQSGTYSAIGDTLNTASRVQSAAEPSSISVTESTYRLIASVFDATDLGGIEVKGKAAPVHCYRIDGPCRREGLEESAAARRIPLVGRQLQLNALMALVSALQKGRGGVAFVIGEPGIGKSRLIDETRELGTKVAPGLLWLEGRATSYGGSLPYGLVIQVLRSFFGTGLATEQEDASKAVGDVLHGLLGTEAGRVVPYVSHLLSLPVGRLEEHPDELEPEALQKRYVESLGELLSAASKNQPTVIVCEDIHWADASSAALLSSLIDIAKRSPVLFLLTSRWELKAPGWKLVREARKALGEALTEMNLTPLSRESCSTFAEELLGSSPPESLNDFLLDVTEGNPLFIEEIIRSHVLPAGPTGRNWRAQAPGSLLEGSYSLHSLMLSSIDRLPEAGRRVLKLAAVIGREFSVELLNRVAGEFGETFDVTRQLNLLEATGVIAVVGTHPELQYGFRHALLQEAAYESLLKSERKGLHAAIGKALEDTYPERTGELAGLLARHFSESGNDERCFLYSVLAADAAFSRYAVSEAASHYARAVEIAIDRPGHGDRLAELLLRLGRALELMDLYDEAVDTYQRLERLGVERHDESLELAGLMAGATALITPAGRQDIPEGQRLATRALALARRSGNRAAESKSLWNLMLAHNFSGGDPVAATGFGEESLAIARQLGDLSQVASTSLDLHWAYLANGQLQESLEALEEASQLWTDLGDKAMLADSLSCASGLKLLMGDFEGVVVDAGKARLLSEQAGNLWGQSFSRLFLCYAHVEMGDLDHAIQAMQESITLAEQGNAVPLQIGSRADLGLTLAQLGSVDEGLALARRAMELSERHAGAFRPWAAASLARVHLLRGEVEEAAAVVALVDPDSAMANLFLPFPVRFPLALARAEVVLAAGDPQASFSLTGALLNELQRLHLKFWIPHALLLHARAAQALGRINEAIEALEKGRSVARETGSVWTLRPILALLGEIARLRGEIAKAETLSDEAKALAGGIKR
jgi:class 3 adenylate cyclase/tetratricopeptide (TPR) repeat protein